MDKPPLTVTNMISTHLDGSSYNHWLEVLVKDLKKIKCKNIDLLI